MILTRLGNKRKVAELILPYFPPHNHYIEWFFGGGGMFFSKPLAQYNTLNDSDDDVFNLFMVLKLHKQLFYRQLELMPITDSLLQHWKKNKEIDPILKAIRFMFLSNFTFIGKGNTLIIEESNRKKNALKMVDFCFEHIKDATLMCDDFRNIPKRISFPTQAHKNRTFIYADPPYLGTDDNYKSGFLKQDTADLFKILVQTGIRFAISEFHNPFVFELAKYYNLNIIEIGKRSNLKNKNTEILVVNYDPFDKKYA